MSTDTISYSTKMTIAQMAEESKRATAEGMRQIAETMREINVTESVSDYDTDTDTDTHSSHSRKRKRSRKSNTSTNSSSVNKLETRIHYLNLELVNAKVEVDDAKNELDVLKKVLSPYNRVNDELSFLKSAMNRVFKDTANLKTVQLDAKFKLFCDETREHTLMCKNFIDKIDKDEIKLALQRVLDAEKRKLVKLTNNYKILILKTSIKEFTVFMTFWLSIAIIFIAFFWQLFTII